MVPRKNCYHAMKDILQSTVASETPVDGRSLRCRDETDAAELSQILLSLIIDSCRPIVAATTWHQLHAVRSLPMRSTNMQSYVSVAADGG